MTSSRRLGCLLFLLLVISYACVHQKGGANQDSRLDLLHGLLIHHTFKIDAYQSNTIDKSVKDGHFYSDKAPGIVFLSLPAFSASLLLVGSLNISADSDQGWLITDWLTTMGSVGLITALGGVALFAFLSKLLNPRFAFLTVLAVFLGSAPFPYATMLFSHAAVLGLISISVWAISDDLFFSRVFSEASARATPIADVFIRRHVLAGVCCGLAIASEYTAAIAAGAVLVLALMISLRRGFTLALAAVPPLLLIPITNWVCFGSPTAFGYHSLSMADFQEMNQGFFGISFPPNLAAAYLILISPERGLFFWTPFFLMAFCGIKPFFKTAPKVCLVIGMAVILQIVAISGYYMPDGGWALGPRHLASVLPFLTILAGYGLARSPMAGVTLGLWSILLTGIATWIDAMPPDWVNNPLRDYYMPRLLNGDFVQSGGLYHGMLSGFPVVVILAVMVGPYLWAIRYLRFPPLLALSSTVASPMRPGNRPADRAHADIPAPAAGLRGGPRLGRQVLRIPFSAKLRPVAVLLGFKIAYLAFVSCLILPPVAKMHPAGRSLQRIQLREDGSPTFESYFTTWDAAHYLHLSEDGYWKGDVSCAFYPLWPYLIRWASVLFGGDKVITGMVLANIFSLIGVLVLLAIVSERFGASAGWWSVALILAFPGSLFFQFIYSESLFLLLVLLLVLGLERKHFTLAFVAALLLPLTRALGILCILPIAVHLLTKCSDRFWPPLRQRRWLRWIAPPRTDSQAHGPLCEPAEICRDITLLLAPFCGWAIYLGAMWLWTGHPFEGFTAQKYWGVQSIGNLFAIPHFLWKLVTPTVWHGWIGSVLDRTTFMLILCSLPLIWRLDKTWFAWTIVLGIVPAISGTFTSFTRFACVVFPTFVALGIWLSEPNRRHFRLGILASFVIIHVSLLYRFIFFAWAG